MKLSEYLKEMTELLDAHGDMDCIYRNHDEGNAYYKVESFGYSTLARVDQMKNDYEVESYDPKLIDLDEQEVEWLIENEYIESEDELVRVCIIN